MYILLEKSNLDIPLALTPSGVRNMLSFLAPLLNLDLLVKSCHLDFPASSSLLAFTLRGTLFGRGGPSLTLLGSLRAWLASVGLISAAAEIILVFCGTAWEEEDDVPGVSSAFRLRESTLFEIGLISLAFNVSVVPYDLKETI